MIPGISIWISDQLTDFEDVESADYKKLCLARGDAFALLKPQTNEYHLPKNDATSNRGDDPSGKPYCPSGDERAYLAVWHPGSACCRLL